MTVRVAINGFGRIGRNILRAIYESGRTDIEVVGINDLGSVEANAHLLKYDSVHGRYPGTVKVDGDTIDLGRGPIKVTAERNPTDLPWGALNVDIAFECTGIFTKRDAAAKTLVGEHSRCGNTANTMFSSRIWTPFVIILQSGCLSRCRHQNESASISEINSV